MALFYLHSRKDLLPHLIRVYVLNDQMSVRGRRRWLEPGRRQQSQLQRNLFFKQQRLLDVLFSKQT